MSGRTTCVLADDHPPVLRFLSSYLGGNGITITATASDGKDALRLIEATRPCVAVLDARMPNLSGIDVTRRLVASGSSTRVVLYTGYGDRALLHAALDAGVRGVIDKEAPVEDLLRAVHVVAGGGTYVDPPLVGVYDAPRRRPLTSRERDVLRHLADGLTNEQMGEALGISSQTVRTHVQKAIEKLGATTRTQAVATALRESLIA